MRTLSAVDVVVIGAGVVGAAVAARLAESGKLVWILDRLPRIGGETTQRNSGVIHAGINTPLGWWKTKLCVEGNRLLYDWAARTGVPHRRSGKLIVAQDESEEESLLSLLAHGREAGVEELRILSGAELQRLEPEVSGRAALFSGTSGVVDAHELTVSLIAAARSHGGEVMTSTEVMALEQVTQGWSIRTSRGPVVAGVVVNSAGLYADDIARLAGTHTYQIHPCRGDYYRVKTKLSCRHLVYPLKRRSSPGLGVHLTIDVNGTQRLGPDADYVPTRSDYGSRTSDKRVAFAAAAQKFLPNIREDDLEFDSCGLRPKLRAPHEADERDFVIAEDQPRFINLVGIESPGLTSALALAREVSTRLE